MYPSQGLLKALNDIRETSIQNNTLYHRQVPFVDATTSITAFGQPILQNPEVANEFISALVNRIAYTSVMVKNFNNPLNQLKGEEIPLGYAGQNIYINPSQAREYNVNDFAGLLVKYEADVKVEYTVKNIDIQYPVSITRQELKKAFTSWGDFERFIDSIVNSLYNGLYITQYNLTKGLVSSAYKNNAARIETVTVPTNRNEWRDFVATMRGFFLNMLAPSREFNAWYKMGGEGRPVVTWNEAQDTVLLIRNDILSQVSVQVLSAAFNMSEAEFLGRVIGIDNFDEYDADGNKIFDGSKILCMLADRRWFKINDQETFIDQFYNANNRVWNYYLNYVSQYSSSLFANAVIFATQEPVVELTSLTFPTATATISAVGEEIVLRVNTNPRGATSEITYTNSDENATFTIEKIDNKTVKLTGVAAGTATLTATANGHSATISVTVSE